MRATTSSSPAVSKRAPRSSPSVCRSSIRPRGCGSCRHCPFKSRLRVTSCEVSFGPSANALAEAAKRSRTCPAPWIASLPRDDALNRVAVVFCNRIIFGECDEALQSFGLGRQPSDADPVPDAHSRRRWVLLLSEARPCRGSVLHGQGGQRLRALAGRDRAGNAGAGRRSHREEDPGAALLREGADLFQARLYRAPGHLPRLHAAEGRAVSLLSAAQEAGRRTGPAALGDFGA